MIDDLTAALTTPRSGEQAGHGLRAPRHRRGVRHVPALLTGDRVPVVVSCPQPLHVRADQRDQVRLLPSQ